MTPLPQYSTNVHFMPGVGQFQPVSITHELEQPSPDVMLPSSHSSPESMMPSPQIGTGTIVQAPPVLGHVQPAVTCEQSAAQPLLPVVSPSSHASSPSTTPSPHTIVEMHGCPAVGQT